MRVIGGRKAKHEYRVGMDRKATKHKMTRTGAHLAEAGANSEERVRVRHVEVW